MRTAIASNRAETIPKKRARHYSYDESVNELTLPTVQRMPIREKSMIGRRKVHGQALRNCAGTDTCALRLARACGSSTIAAFAPRACDPPVFRCGAKRYKTAKQLP